MVIRMTPLTTERLFWHCGAHTAKPNISPTRPIPPIPYTDICCFLRHVVGVPNPLRRSAARRVFLFGGVFGASARSVWRSREMYTQGGDYETFAGRECGCAATCHGVPRTAPPVRPPPPLYNLQGNSLIPLLILQPDPLDLEITMGQCASGARGAIRPHAHVRVSHVGLAGSPFPY